MNTTTSIMIISLTLSMILMTLNYLITLMKPDNEKLSPYECGFDPLESARLPFSIRFFLVAILFLLFDLEIALLLPLPWAIQLPYPTLSFTWALIILSMLTLGLIYEWIQGGLEWAE
uniref:NADH-ubiquinone oxidoreductase chain 3 n=1 Tax=Aldabrachelys gigantea TaxID=167804 RepID=A0A0S1RQN6_ALDGI|nr:NADH dehydrogenase subunit 3 [Aldabrachelys gigantea]ALL96792.1 NADH dehydrogenase subunit 3 [Aldabrachelys gigantea]